VPDGFSYVLVNFKNGGPVVPLHPIKSDEDVFAAGACSGQMRASASKGL
jgi:hypothetical protein